MALTTSETSNRKPRAATNPRLTARALMAAAEGFAFQIAFNADCISPNTPEAVRMSVTRPIRVAIVPDDFLDALATAVCINCAVWSPIKPLSCPVIALCAAS